MNVKKVAFWVSGVFLTIVALAAYRRYMRYEHSVCTDEQKTSQKQTNQASDATHDGIRKEYFLALAPAYLAGSYYLMQASSKGTTWLSSMLPYGKYIDNGLSVFLLVWALFLCYLAFGKIPKSVKDAVYGTVAGFGSLTLIFYMYNWIENLVGIINSGIGLWYFYLLYIFGLIVIAAVAVYPLGISVMWVRKKTKSS